jgi:hypothetical protein
MPTQYLTFILRVRLEPRQEAQEATPKHRLCGSLQQAGSDQVYYFDSIQKLQDALAKTLPIHTSSATT